MQLRYLGKAFLLIVILAVAALGSVALFNCKKPHVIIVNNPGAGRLGDQLLGYSKAKYLSLKYNIPFLLIPFEYSDQLTLSQEKHYTRWSFFLQRVFYKLFARVVWVHTEEDMVEALKTLNGPTRFIAHLNTRFFEHINANVGLDRYMNSWAASFLYELTIKYPDFGAELKKMLQPLQPPPLMNLPKDRLSVAVHIRKGGGYFMDPDVTSQQYYSNEVHAVNYEQFCIDSDNQNFISEASKNIPAFDYDLTNRDSVDKIHLDKFPPEQYYVEQIKNLSDFLNDVPLYVYIFTDDPEPVQLTKRVDDAVNKENIVFACRTSKNTHDTNVIDDWFALTYFDCLIRSGSFFPHAAQLIGHHKVIIYPLHLKWLNNQKLVADRVGITIRDKELFKRKYGTKNSERRGS